MSQRLVSHFIIWSSVVTSPPPTADVKNVWNYNTTPPIRLHGVVLN